MFEFELALKYLKKNKKESISIIACIAVAITLILGVDIGAHSVQLKQIEMAREIAGYYEGMLITNNKDNIKRLKKIDGVYNVQTVQDLGEVIPQDGLKTKFYTFNEDYLKSLNYKLVSGRFPENENEIVIDKNALDKFYQEKILNKEISLVNKIEYDLDEVNKIYSKKNEYKVVGFISKVDGYYELANDEATGGIELLSFIKTSKNVLPNELIKYETVFNIEGVNPETLDKKFSHIRKEYNPKLDHTVDIREDGKSGIYSNPDLDTALRYYTDQLSNNAMQEKIFLIVIAGFTIVNFFNIILTKITNQLGYLRVIGMSNKKVIKFYLIQIFILFSISSIIGFISSVIFAKYSMGTITTINTFYINNFSEIKLSIPYLMVIKALIIVLSILLLTIFLPILKSLKKYPIDIINKSDKVKYKAKNNKKIVITLLKKNLFRKKSKTIMPIIIIAFIGTIILKGPSIMNLLYIDEQLEQYESYSANKYNYNIRHDLNADESIQKLSSKDISKIKNTDGIKDFKLESYKLGHLIIENEKDMKTKEVGSFFEGIEEINKLNEFVKDGDIKKLNQSEGEYINIAVCNTSYNIKDANYKAAIKNLKVEDKLHFKIKVKDNNDLYYYKNIKANVVAILDESYTYTNGNLDCLDMRICMNLNNFEKFTNNNYIQKICFNGEESNYPNIDKVLEDIKKDNKYLYIYNKEKEMFKPIEDDGFEISFDDTIFSLMIASVLFNIFMTINLNINNNIKEFSILRAIGLNKKSLKKLIIYESAFYVFIGSILSIIYISIDDLKTIKYYKEVYAPGVGADLKLKPIYLPPKEAFIYMLIAVSFAILVGYFKSKAIDKIEIIDGINEN